MNHYDWLDKNFPSFLSKLNIDFNNRCPGIISAHGDKAYGYRDRWEREGISFDHGVAIYLLTYLRPWMNEMRDTENGWVDPGDWVIKNYDKFKEFL